MDIKRKQAVDQSPQLSSPKKQKNEEDSGQKQLKRLIDKIEQNEIYTSQSTKNSKFNSKSLSEANNGKPESIRSFIKSKIDNNARKEISCFKYLYNQSIETSEEDIELAIQQLDKEHGLCSINNFHHQTKIPCGETDEEKSMRLYRSKQRSKDQSGLKSTKAESKRGLIQVQTYNIIDAVMDSEDDESFLKLLKESYQGKTKSSVGAHLCKQKCKTPKHTIDASRKINQVAHEACPAYWMIKGKLCRFCVCQEQACLAPGLVFVDHGREQFIVNIQTFNKIYN